MGRAHSPLPQASPASARWAVVCAALAFCCVAVLASSVLAQSFPALTGRIVDAANLLKPEERAALDTKLKAHEDKTSDQVVVATVPSLDGLTVEDYANRLFRQWKLGQSGKNNGVLLLVAPKERKVRIEVGYGLEGALTDALSKVIITTAIAPQFQKGNFSGGIDAGVDAMLSILTGDAEEWQRRAQVREDDSGSFDPWVAIFVIVMLFIIVSSIIRDARARPLRGGRHGGPWIIPTGGGWSGGSSGGGWSGGGGFSGGGGSSGGGGASGSW
ncbi:TPM domain-containing protein [Microvirga rosea]|uniref:TPM domain-containing protein n=1 Tax=Microvirga rosea TaxID=2715425 RepID=UPI003872E201